MGASFLAAVSRWSTIGAVPFGLLNCCTSQIAEAFPKASAPMLPQSCLPPRPATRLNELDTAEPHRLPAKLFRNGLFIPFTASVMWLPVLPVIPEDTVAIAKSVQLKWVSRPATLLLTYAPP